jgi:hypothetical protein
MLSAAGDFHTLFPSVVPLCPSDGQNYAAVGLPIRKASMAPLACNTAGPEKPVSLARIWIEAKVDK